eukprot:scaffold87093_cov25-Tisochrysis_lutea.AAC.4
MTSNCWSNCPRSASRAGASSLNRTGWVISSLERKNSRRSAWPPCGPRHARLAPLVRESASLRHPTPAGQRRSGAKHRSLQKAGTPLGHASPPPASRLEWTQSDVARCAERALPPSVIVAGRVPHRGTAHCATCPPRKL